MSDSVQSVAKAMRILSAFDHMSRLLTVREISAKTAIPRSTVHDICRTLVAADFLEARAEGGFQLGMGLAMLGGQVIERQGIVEAAQRPIQNHLDHFGVEVHIGVHVPGAVFYAYRKRAVSRAATLNRTGRRWALHTSGCGLAILAAMTPSARESELAPLATAEDSDRLEIVTGMFARLGYIVTDVSQPGLTSVAAPVLDATGLPVGAIGTADSAASMSRARIAQFGEAVRATAEETSRSLGWNRAVCARGTESE